MARKSQPNRNSSYDLMQKVLLSQLAASEETRQAMQEIKVTMSGLMNSMDTMISPTHGPGAGSYGTAPHNNRPTMSGNGTSRPTLTPYGTSTSTPGRGLAGVRHHITRHLNSQYGSGSGSTYETMTNRVTGEVMGYRETAPNGVTRIHDADWANTEEGASALASAGKRSMISSILGGAEGAGIMGAARAVPYLGTAIMGAEAIHEGLTFAAKQRAANAPWQNIYGGSNIDQYGQRAQQFGFQMSNLFSGGLTWAQSAQAFQGVSALGYQGTQRSQDLNFITSNYMNMGVSVSESLKLITTAANDLNESLTGLQQGLQGTRQAAISTGQSGEAGTQAFTNMMQGLSGTFAGPGVATTSAILAPMQEQTGRYLSQNMNLAGPLSNMGTLAMMSHYAGMPLSQMIGAVQSGNLSATMKGMSGLMGQTFKSSLSPQVSQFIMQQANAMGGLANIGPDQAAQIASALQNQKFFNGYTTLQQANAYGWGFTNDQAAAQAMVEYATGNLFSPNQVKNAGILTGKSTSSLLGTMNNSINASTRKTASNMKINMGPDVINKAVNDANPMISAARKALMGAYGQRSNTPADVQVMDHGKTRVMSFDEAVKYFPDQIAKGTAIIMGSGGQTITEKMGGQHQTSYTSANEIINEYNKKYGTHYQDETTPTLGAASKSTSGKGLETGQGMTVTAYERWRQQWDKQHPSKGSPAAQGKASGGTVVISPSPELNALLSYSTSGNVQIATQGAMTGTVPLPPGS